MPSARRLILAVVTVALATGGVRADSAWHEDVLAARRLYQAAAGQADLRQVVLLLEQALAKDVPERRLGEVQFLLGCAWFDLGEGAAAVRALRSAVEADPRDPQYRLWLAHAYDLDGRSTLAVRALQQVVSDPLTSPADREAARTALAGLHEPLDLARREPPERLASAGVVVRHHAGEPFAAAVRDALALARVRLLEVLGLDVTEPVEVVLFRDAAEYQAYHAARAMPRPEWSTACTSNGRIFTYPAAGLADGLLSTLTHEYTHVALRAYADDRGLPCWLDEGLAVLLSNQFPNHRTVVARAPALLSMRALNVPSFGGYERDDAYLAYAQSKAMVEDLLARHGAVKLRGYLRELGRGAEASQAFERVYAQTMEEYLSWWVAERADGR